MLSRPEGCEKVRLRGLILTGLACLSAAFLTAGMAVAAQLPARWAPEVGHARLEENGLDVYVYEDHAAPLVSVMVWYRAGSRHEPPDRRGLAHLLEHMMFMGSRRVGPEEHSQLIQRAGGVSNAFTTFDATAYWEKVPASQLELALALEAERMAHLDMTETKLATEREVVKEEYRLRLENNPFGHAFDRFYGLMFAGTPYGWTPAGSIEDIDRVSLADLQRFYQTHYVPNNAVLVVAGDTTLQQVVALARRYFGKIPPGPQPPDPPVPFEAPRRPRPGRTAGGASPGEMLELPVQLPGVIAGYALPGAGHPDQYPLAVAGTLLSRGELARLNRRLVREQRLAVSASAGPEAMKHAGAFLLFALYLPDRDPRRVLEAVRQEVERLAGEQPPAAEELERAKHQLAASLAFESDSLDGVAERIGWAVVVEGGLDAFTKGLERLMAVTASDVQRATRTYLRPDNLTALTVVPSGEQSRGTATGEDSGKP